MTRRGLAGRLAGAAALIGWGGRGSAAVAEALPPIDADLRDAALRGLALAGHRGDPVAKAVAQATIDRLAMTDPEAALLARLYQRLDVRPAQVWRADAPPAGAADLALLHDAIRDCRPVGFGYTDLSGRTSQRAVLPLVLVHPPQGVKLLAWCGERADFRQFFVREMTGLAVLTGDFAPQRLALLEGLLAKETARDWPAA
ncbi:helix-turn-helix transcriptional regulator [Paracoccus sp. p3-h83]|uniref:helix-turn-helix transcriptional regulator n=1 Tax=Paracoccus sp. p3-h83 TaxID=3342805 RepID=UPI0035B7E4F4